MLEICVAYIHVHLLAVCLHGEQLQSIMSTCRRLVTGRELYVVMDELVWCSTGLCLRPSSSQSVYVITP